MIERLFEKTRFLVLAVVVVSFCAAIILYCTIVMIMFGVVMDIFNSIHFSETGGKLLVVKLLKILDISLIAITFQLISVGLYRLFIRPSALENSAFLSALTIKNFHDLKITLLQVSVVIMVILFLEHLVEVGASIETLYLGAGISLVIFSAIGAWKMMR